MGTVATRDQVCIGGGEKIVRELFFFLHISQASEHGVSGCHYIYMSVRDSTRKVAGSSRSFTEVLNLQLGTAYLPCRYSEHTKGGFPVVIIMKYITLVRPATSGGVPPPYFVADCTYIIHLALAACNPHICMPSSKHGSHIFMKIKWDFTIF